MRYASDFQLEYSYIGETRQSKTPWFLNGETFLLPNFEKQVANRVKVKQICFYKIREPINTQ